MAKPITVTAERIQVALYDALFFHGWRFWLFNTYYFKWESDCLAFNDKGHTMEIEIKRSHDDFRADFTKHKHSNFRCRFMTENRLPTKFYYACEPDVIAVEELPDYAGLIYIHKGSAGLKCTVEKVGLTLTYESANEQDLFLIIERSNQKMIEAWRKIGRV